MPEKPAALRLSSPPGLLLCSISSACANHLSAVEGLDAPPPRPLHFYSARSNAAGRARAERSVQTHAAPLTFQIKEPDAAVRAAVHPSRKAKQTTTTTTTTHTAPLITGAMPASSEQGHAPERWWLKILYLRDGVMMILNHRNELRFHLPLQQPRTTTSADRRPSLSPCLFSVPLSAGGGGGGGVVVCL